MGSLSRRRLGIGFAVGLVSLLVVTPLLFDESEASLARDVLVYQLIVVVVALIGGIWPATATALAAGMLLDYLFIEPRFTARIDDPLHALALVVFVIVAVLVSVVVDQAERRSQAAARSSREAATLADLAGSVLRGEDGIASLADRLREIYALSAVTVEWRGSVVHRSAAANTPTPGAPGVASGDDPTQVLALGPEGRLVIEGGELAEGDQRILRAFALQIEAGLEHRVLQAEAERAVPLEAADRMRTALLAAVSHDLRTPLAAATAAVGALASTDVQFGEHDRAELLDTAAVSLDRLGRLVNDLLDVSRLQAGVIAVSLARVALDEVVPLALDDIGAAPEAVAVRLQSELPEVGVDPVLLQRIVANLVANALRYSPPGSRPEVGATVVGDRVELVVVDHGPGVEKERLDAIFQPFQRHGDEDASTGVGLGLALSRGFAEAMGGTIRPERTAGGGLTMVVSLPIDPTSSVAGDRS